MNSNDDKLRGDGDIDSSVRDLADEISRIMDEETTPSAPPEEKEQIDDKAISSALEAMADQEAVSSKPEETDDAEIGDTSDNTRILPTEDVKSSSETGSAEAVSDQLPDEDETEENTAKGSHKGRRKALFIVLGVIAAVYAAGVIFFSFYFGPYTIINDVDCSYASEGSVESMIASQVSSYKLILKERNNQTETVSGEDVGLQYVADGQVRQLLKDQNAFIWPYRFFIKDQLTGTQTHASVTMDVNKFASVVSKLKCMDTANMIAPADAFPELQGSTYAVHPEVEGTTIITDTFNEKVKEAILDTADSIDLDAEGCYKNPTILSDSQELKNTVDTINKYMVLTITYHLGDKTEVLDGSTTSSWFSWDENMNPTISQDAITAWVADFASRHDTVGTTRTFTAANGSTCTVTGGTYGWKLDQQSEIDSINQMFTDMTSQDRDPAWKLTAASFGDTDWGTTYIDLDLTNQHVYFIQNGASVFDCDVVTGLPTPAKITPDGVWSILEKQQNKTLRGDRQTDGSYTYETPVAYWLRMTWTGVGFHDASWQPFFGGNRYTYAGSHGCINMSYSTVQQLYSLADVGCPVVSHY